MSAPIASPPAQAPDAPAARRPSTASRFLPPWIGQASSGVVGPLIEVPVRVGLGAVDQHSTSARHAEEGTG